MPRDSISTALDHYLSFLYTPRDRVDLQGRAQAAARAHLLRGATDSVDVEQLLDSCRPTRRSTARRRTPSSSCARVLRDAVRSHLVSDVPLGAFLSGGVDSSLVVGLMAEASSRAGEDLLDRLRRAGVRRARARAARRAALRHRPPRVRRAARRARDPRPDLIGALRRAVRRPSAIPTWYVSEMARRHVTVVLSGDGGDELFGGYDRYVPHPRVVALRPLPVPGKRGAGRRSPRARCRTARAARTSCATSARDERGPLPRCRSRFFGAGRKAGAARRRTFAARLTAPDPEDACWRATSSGSRHLPLAEPDDAVRLRDVPARGRADEGRPHEHGALDRVARAAARQRGRSSSPARCRVAEDQGRTAASTC